MLDREQSTPAPIPRIDPAQWEDFAVFRETFLLHLTDPEANAAFRLLGALAHELFLEHARHFPSHPDLTESELTSGLADLRQLQGFFAAVGREHEESVLSASQAARSRFAGEIAADLGRIADRLDAELQP